MTSEDVKEMAAVKMPKESVDFLRRNPDLASAAGKLMVSLIEVNIVRKKIIELFREPELFSKYLVNGTKEELKQFVEAALASQEGAMKFEGLPPGAFNKIVKEMGDHMLATEVHVVNGPENKEVTG